MLHDVEEAIALQKKDNVAEARKQFESLLPRLRGAKENPLTARVLVASAEAVLSAGDYPAAIQIRARSD